MFGQDIEVQRAGSSGTGIPRGEIQQHGTQEGDGDPDRTDHHVFPGRFQRGAGAAMSHQKRGDHRGGLDRYPNDADVVGAHRQNHRAKKRRGQHPIQPSATSVDMPVCQLGVDVADARRGGQCADDPDDDEHDHRQRIGAQQTAQPELRPRPHPKPHRHSAGQHRRGGQRGERRRRASPPGDQGGD